jgi:TonB family protein
MSGMNRPMLVVAGLFWVCGYLFAQDTQVSVVKPEGIVYPPMALAARVSGEVILSIALAPNGSASGVTVESGPPMLRQAAIESAKRSQFHATLGDGAGRYLLVYRFVLDQTTECEHDDSYPRVTHEANVVTVIEQNVPICDPGAVVVHFRSIKCLYLWKCASRM